MNKSLITKIALGLIVVAVPVFIFFSSKGENVESQPGINQEEIQDVSENLYEDTFEENDEELAIENDEYINTDIIDETISDVENTTSSESIPENNKEENVNTESKTVTGIYQGFADDNFVEIKIGDSYGVFKASGEIKSKISSKNIGDSITLTYVASGAQQIITSVN